MRHDCVNAQRNKQKQRKLFLKLYECSYWFLVVIIKPPWINKNTLHSKFDLTLSLLRKTSTVITCSVAGLYQTKHNLLAKCEIKMGCSSSVPDSNGLQTTNRNNPDNVSLTKSGKIPGNYGKFSRAHFALLWNTLQAYSHPPSSS